MRIGKDVMLEIVSIIQDALIQGIEKLGPEAVDTSRLRLMV